MGVDPTVSRCDIGSPTQKSSGMGGLVSIVSDKMKKIGAVSPELVMVMVVTTSDSRWRSLGSTSYSITLAAAGAASHGHYQGYYQQAAAKTHLQQEALVSSIALNSSE